MHLPAAPLEDWLRDYYFTAEIDISASGVEPYSLGEIRALTGLNMAELDRLVFQDGHSYGEPAVRELIAQRWGTGDASRVITTNGSSEAIFLVLSGLLEAGDDVVVVEPGYHSLVHMATSLGCNAKVWRLDDGEHVFRPSLADMAALVTERTRAIIVNFPHNPTGVSISEDEMRLLLDRAREVGAWVVWDTAFSDIVYDGPPLPDICGLYDRVISIGTFSKCFGLPGLRFGWCIASEAVLSECVRIRDYATLHLSPLVELVALRALENLDALLEPRRAQARDNREVLRSWAESHGDGVSMALPAGGVAAFPRLNAVDDVDAFCTKLVNEHGVIVIPGSCFARPQHIRVGFGGPPARLVEGLDRLDLALASL